MPVDEVVDALNGKDPIPKERVLAWMREPSLATRGAVYVLTDREWSRIQPELSMQEQCTFMGNYLVECLASDPPETDWVHRGFEAGHLLAAWFKHLHGIAGTKQVLTSAAAQLTEAYRKSDKKARNRIETGALEHIFEQPALRAYFVEWRNDPELGEAYKWAVRWGDDHLVGSGRSIEEIAQGSGGDT
jgi:hypothetical protein